MLPLTARPKAFSYMEADILIFHDLLDSQSSRELAKAEC